MADSEAAVSAPLPVPPGDAAEADPAAPRSPPRRRLTGPTPLTAKTIDAGGGGPADAAAAGLDGAAAPPADRVLKQVRSADYTASAGGADGLADALSGKFRRAARSEEVSADSLARALHGVDQAAAVAAEWPDSEAGRTRRLTGGRRLLPPRSASMERELQVAAGDGVRGSGLPSSPTRRQGGAQPTMNGHLEAGEVRRLNTPALDADCPVQLLRAP